jgi:hypothetical protein
MLPWNRALRAKVGHPCGKQFFAQNTAASRGQRVDGDRRAIGLK